MGDIEAQDRRRQNWLWVDNEIITEYGAQIGTTGIALYCALAMYANKTRECWPSRATLARQLAVSEQTVGKYLSKLEEVGLVRIEPRFDEDGRQTSNLYVLVDVPKRTGGRGQNCIPLQGYREDTPNHTTPEPDSPPSVEGGRSAPPAPTRYSVPRSERKPRSRIPAAVSVFRSEAHRYPAKTWYAAVSEAVGEDQSALDRWRALVHDWVGRGWNPGNVAGLLDVWAKGGVIQGNGKAREPTNLLKAKPDDYWEKAAEQYNAAWMNGGTDERE